MNLQFSSLKSVLDDQKIGYVFACMGAIFFSMKGIFIKLAYGEDGSPDVDAVTLLALRMLFALPVYLAIGIFVFRRRPVTKPVFMNGKNILYASLVGILGYYLASYLDFLGLIYITAQFERLILYTYPFFVVLLSALFFRERIHNWMVLSLVISYSGIFLIFFQGATAKGDHVWLGALFVLGAALAYALHQLLAKPIISRIGSQEFTCIAMIAACIVCVAQYFTAHSVSDLLKISEETLYLAFLLALVSTVFPSFLLNAGIARIGPQSVAIIATLSPIATIFFATTLLGEKFSSMDALGTFIVILGVSFFTWRDSISKKQTKAP